MKRNSVKAQSWYALIRHHPASPGWDSGQEADLQLAYGSTEWLVRQCAESFQNFSWSYIETCLEKCVINCKKAWWHHYVNSLLYNVLLTLTSGERNMEEMIVHTAQNNCFVMQHLAKSALVLLKHFIWIDFFSRPTQCLWELFVRSVKKAMGIPIVFVPSKNWPAGRAVT